MSEQPFVLIYRVYSVSTDNILMWICEVSYTSGIQPFLFAYPQI
jgi:hypothetical protein